MNRLKDSKISFIIIIKGLYNKKIDWSSLLVNLVLVVIIVILISRIVIAYESAEENRRNLEKEEEKLIELQEKNKELTEEENYYRSIEFRKAYARDSLNLTKEKESLYMVIRDKPEEVQDSRPKLFNSEDVNPLELWKLLILGR